MIKFDKTQLINQIKNECLDVDEIFSGIFRIHDKTRNEIDHLSVTERWLPVCVVGQFEGPLGETKVCVVVADSNDTMLQVYESRRQRYIPSSSPSQPLNDWKIIEEIFDHYVTYPTRPDVVILKF